MNAVIPGLIDTESQEAGRVEQFGPTVPIRRAGRPEEVAHAVLWLLSAEASYVTGALVDVTGGMIVWWCLPDLESPCHPTRNQALPPTRTVFARD